MVRLLYGAEVGQAAVATRCGVGEPNQAAIDRSEAWRPEMSQKRQPDESDGPRRASGGGGEFGGSSSSSSLPQRPGEPKRQRIALRE